MPTLVNTIDSKELYAARAVADAAGNDIAQTYATKAELPGELTAGSGVEIISDVVNAKVDGTTVTFDANGRLTATGGGSSVNADWDAVSGPEAILNKPTPKTLTAGSNITVTETASTITISATGAPTIAWTEVTSEITGTAAITGGAWHFYYNAYLKMIAIIGEIHVQADGAVYTLPVKYRPLENYVLASPSATSFIDYTASTGVYSARSGADGYFSVCTTTPCTGE